MANGFLFIGGTVLKNETCKFKLCPNVTKKSLFSARCNTFRFGNALLVSLEYLMPVLNMNSENVSFFCKKVVKNIEFFKIRGTSCHDLSVTCKQPPKDGFSEYLKFKSGTFSVFPGF